MTKLDPLVGGHLHNLWSSGHGELTGPQKGHVLDRIAK